MTEVEVDVLTGEKNVVRADIIEDTGSSVNPAVDMGQVGQNYIVSKSKNVLTNAHSGRGLGGFEV